MREEQIVVGANSAFPLNGCLTLPQGEGPFPAIVLVHGSGASNLNSKVGKSEPFKDLAHGLAQQGIATIRYDKRTFAHKRKVLKIKALSVKEETIEDALLATTLLRNHPAIAADQVYVLGLSMGGMLAPRMDAQGGNFAGLIIASGSPRRFEEISATQNKAALAQLKNPLRWLVAKQGAKMARKLEGVYALSEEQALKQKIVPGVSAYYFKEMGEHPASLYLKDLDKPMLILQGEQDFQVSVEEDFQLYKKLLVDKTCVSYRLYPGLNHALMPAKYTNVLKAKQEYNRENHVAQQVIDDIAAWIQAQKTK